MATIKPFRGLRPPRELVEQVESRPYDVLESEEARVEAGDNEKSLYHIIKPEIDFPVGTSEYDPRVYEQATKNFEKFQQQGWLKQDAEDMYYIYAQTMNGKTQYGLVVAALVEDYTKNGVIKKHELTRRDKEEDRMKHVRATNANMEPVFFAYKDNEVIDALVARYAKTEPEYDFIAPIDGFRHQLWLVKDKNDIETITSTFSHIPYLYIADGHHRSAAAALVGAEKASQNPNHQGREEYNYFMAVCFPASQLTILDYNRVVKDLNGRTPQEFLAALGENFDIECFGKERIHPKRKHQFSLYVDGYWYLLTLHDGLANDADPIGGLDVSVSSDLILDKLLNITDLRGDKRIDFVGGLRGYEELERRVDSGEMKMALALYPVSMQEIMDIADNGQIMPPKATWFEPKLRSGLVVHKLS